MLYSDDELSIFLQNAKRYGLVLDTCIAILFIVGLSDEKQIPLHEKLKDNKYDASDYQRLVRLSKHINGKFFVLTPYIVTEIEFQLKILQSRGGILRGKEHLFKCYTNYLNYADNICSTSKSLVRDDYGCIMLHGIADTSIVNAACQGGYAVLTDDSSLYGYLKQKGVATLLFENLGNMNLLSQSKELHEFGIDEHNLACIAKR